MFVGKFRPFCPPWRRRAINDRIRWRETLSRACPSYNYLSFLTLSWHYPVSFISTQSTGDNAWWTGEKVEWRDLSFQALLLPQIKGLAHTYLPLPWLAIRCKVYVGDERMAKEGKIDWGTKGKCVSFLHLIVSSNCRFLFASSITHILTFP